MATRGRQSFQQKLVCCISVSVWSRRGPHWGSGAQHAYEVWENEVYQKAAAYLSEYVTDFALNWNETMMPRSWSLNCRSLTCKCVLLKSLSPDFERTFIIYVNIQYFLASSAPPPALHYQCLHIVPSFPALRQR